MRSMKTFLLTLIASIASAFGFYIAVRAVFIAVVWFFDMTLTYEQRLCVEDSGYFTFLLGGVIGGMVGWRIFRVNKA
jgi:hypothetical protein